MRTKKGTITSAKMTGTVSVTVESSVLHPIYKKRFKQSKKFLADTTGVTDLVAGDTVIITECRPISKNKYFRVTEVVERVPRVSDIKDEAGIDKLIHREKKGKDAKKEDSPVTK
ncbi:MAG: 30S ribosomal protein S17 [Candidatus Peribacteraceae bacterium]|nr:30S ribosomal protein S17 [Candidatus Peribacteraceae bacterium]MDD5074937.1 30S ribosomal protein S17 [Candidatus Peribacteraceae bacterium]